MECHSSPGKPGAGTSSSAVAAEDRGPTASTSVTESTGRKTPFLERTATEPGKVWDPSDRRETVDQNQAPAEVRRDRDDQKILNEAPVDEQGRPVDHRTGDPLDLRGNGETRGWVVKYDPETGKLVAQNNGSAGEFPQHGEPNSYGYDEHGKLKPYANGGRPPVTLETKQALWRLQAGLPDHVMPGSKEWNESRVIVTDKNGDDREIQWDGTSNHGKSAGKDAFDVGHAPGREYRRLLDEYLAGDMTYDDFLAANRDVTKLEIQDVGRNRSHIDEDKSPLQYEDERQKSLIAAKEMNA